MQQHPPAPPPPPPPLLSPDGRYVGNGTGWARRPWQLTIARALVFLESGLLALLGLLLVVAVGTFGLLANADNGAGFSPIGRAMLVVAVVTAIVVAAVIVLGVKMVRRRWAYRTVAAFQVALVVGLGVSVASYASSTNWTPTNIAVASIEVLCPAVTLALLLAPQARPAMLPRRSPAQP
jgi:hypothetical protein